MCTYYLGIIFYLDLVQAIRNVSNVYIISWNHFLMNQLIKHFNAKTMLFCFHYIR